MAAGKPILIVADKNSEISLCVNEHNIGWVVKPNEPILLSEAFENVYKEFIQNDCFNITHPREVALKYFSKDIILNNYLKLFK